MFLLTLKQVVNLFLFMILGYVLSKKKIMPRETANVFSKLLVWVCSPALYLNTFSTQFSSEELKKSLVFILAAVVALAVSYFGALLLRKPISRDGYSQNVFIYSACIPNFGYMGNVLILALIGQTALLQFQIFVIPFTIFMVTGGYSLLLDRKTGIKGIINPMIIALFAGIILGLLNLRLPDFVCDMLTGASDCMGPISMILAGCVIADFDLKKIISRPEVYRILAICMVIKPLIVVLIGKAFRIPQDIFFPLLAFNALPTGLNSIVYPSTVNKDCSLGAGLALISNILAIVTVPLFFSLAV